MSSSAPVSVIIPCWRCVDTIPRVLESVADQTLLPTEVILIDDASGDGTVDCLKNLAAKYPAGWVRVIEMPKNGGPGLARNVGWEAATQPWLAFLDADDVWHPEKLSVQYAWLLQHPDVVLCGHGTRFLADGESYDAPQVTNVVVLSVLKMLISNRLPTRSVMLRRDLPFRFRGKEVTEDYLLWLQIVATGRRACRLESTLAYSLRPDFSAGGYSGQLWRHERRELAALAALREEGALGVSVFCLACLWSLTKYCRRRLKMWGRA